MPRARFDGSEHSSTVPRRVLFSFHVEVNAQRGSVGRENLENLEKTGILRLHRWIPRDQPTGWVEILKEMAVNRVVFVVLSCRVDLYTLKHKMEALAPQDRTGAQRVM